MDTYFGSMAVCDITKPIAFHDIPTDALKQHQSFIVQPRFHASGGIRKVGYAVSLKASINQKRLIIPSMLVLLLLLLDLLLLLLTTPVPKLLLLHYITSHSIYLGPFFKYRLLQKPLL